MLRLFAPFLPFVTEEVWSWWQPGSVHRANWPDAAEIERDAGDAESAYEHASAITAVIRQQRSEKKLGFSVPVRAHTSAMHKSETVDYGIMLAGERVLVLDTGTLVMKPGDVVVQLGNWHLWSSERSDVTMAFVMMGARFND